MRLSLLNVSWAFSLAANESISSSSSNEDELVPSAKQPQVFNDSNGLSNKHDNHKPCAGSGLCTQLQWGHWTGLASFLACSQMGH